MSHATVSLPSGAVNCRSGDYLLQRTAPQGWTVFQVEALVTLSKLLPLGGRVATEFVEERHGVDSTAPAGMDELSVLGTLFAAAWPSESAAIQAIETGGLGASVTHICLDLRQFPTDDTIVYTPQ